MIRKATSEDFSFIYGLYMHPLVNGYLLYEMMNAATFQPIFTDLVFQQILYVYEHHNEKIGMVKLVPLTYRSSHVVYCGGVAIHPNVAGKGHGLTMMQEAIDYLKENGFLRIELSVTSDNNRAVHLYEKVGFKKIGILHKYCYLQSKNIYEDEWMMEYLMVEG